MNPNHDLEPAGAATPADDGRSVSARAHRGVAWAVVITGLAFPLPFLRNYLLTRIDSSSHLLGQYNLVLRFQQAVQTFFYPGGSNIFPTFYPKLKTSEERSGLIRAFLRYVLSGAALAVLVLLLFPGLLETALDATTDSGLRIVYLLLIPFALLSALATSAVIGHMSFVWASIVQRTQLILITLSAAFTWWAASGWMRDHPLLWFGVIATVAAIITTAVSAAVLVKTFNPKARPAIPAGCARFSVLTWLDTVFTFAYVAIDQYIINHLFGTAQLGVYAALYDIARIIPLTMQQFGHYLLATLAALIGQDAGTAVTRGYRSVARYSASVFAVLSIVILFFSKPLAALFGDNCAASHQYLLWLAVAMNIDSLTTVNNRALMAYERMGHVVLSKLFQTIVQLVLTLIFVERWGISGIIFAKAAGHGASSVVQAMAVARLPTTERLTLPTIYLVCQAIVLVSGIAAHLLVEGDWTRGLTGAMVAGGALWLGGRFTLGEIRGLIPRPRHERDTG
ncbi:MAG: lipopolysaccharide biosynthesis protein [Phycisphaerales bacterium]|nr:lipopolysaccharide biosynthesis protein [Phycisphaerales bacterium]